MKERKSTNNTTTTTDPSSTAIVANEFTCQLQPECFDVLEWCHTATVALLKDVCICDGDVEQKLKNILIKFSAFGSAAVIASNLVTPVNSTHEIVIVKDGQWAWNRYPGAILLSSKYTALFRLAGGRHDCDNLPIHPGACAHVSFLDGKEITPMYLAYMYSGE